jgi:predicted nucleic acid-binding protein
MSVVDASLAAKWIIVEPNSAAALAFLEECIDPLVAPDLIAIEVSSAIVRRANMDKALGQTMRDANARWASLLDAQTITLRRPTSGDILEAANLAINIGHPLKDCLYLALAMYIGCDLITCDAKFAVKAKGVWDRVRVLGDTKK